jgi:hypothetical protein
VAHHVNALIVETLKEEAKEFLGILLVAPLRVRQY